MGQGQRNPFSASGVPEKRGREGTLQCDTLHSLSSLMDCGANAREVAARRDRFISARLPKKPALQLPYSEHTHRSPASLRSFVHLALDLESREARKQASSMAT